MSDLKREQFFWNFTEKGIIPSCYPSVFLNGNTISNKHYSPILNKAIYVSLFPRFFKPEIKDENYKIKKLIHLNFTGAGINLENAIDVDSHLKTILPSAFRSNLKRLNKRLETCFSITYKMYCGNIDRNNCTEIIKLLIEMQAKRLNQRRLNNNLADKYENYKKIVFPLINEGKASLFVIYNNNKPIAITLNFIQEKIYFGALTAYDLDYAKFGLGNILMYKQLDWCIKNKLLYFDMGNGDLSYKSKWSNSIYDFEYHIIYQKKSLSAYFIATLEAIKIQSKNHIKRLNVKARIHKILKSKNEAIIKNSPAIKTEKIKDFSSISNVDLTSIDIESDLYAHVKLHFLNFLFSSSEHYNTTSIKKIDNETDAYIFKGVKHIQKISLY